MTSFILTVCVITVCQTTLSQVTQVAFVMTQISAVPPQD